MLKLGIIVLLLTGIAVPSLLFATQGQQETEARINARKLEDGRVEFSMQVREGNSWSERILPRGRYFPADAEAGRWLNSTPVAIELGGYAQLPITTAGMYILEQDAFDNRITFRAQRMFTDSGITSIVTEVQAEGLISNSEIATPTLVLSCAMESPEVTPWVQGWPAPGFRAFVTVQWRQHPETASLFFAYRYQEDDYGRLEYDREGEKILVEQLEFQPIKPRDNLDPRLVPDWSLSRGQMLRIKGFHVLSFAFYGWDGELVVASFDVKQTLGTPVQPNLDHCGTYDHGEELYTGLPEYYDGH